MAPDSELVAHTEKSAESIGLNKKICSLQLAVVGQR